MSRTIAIIVPDLYGGGAERVATTLADGLSRRHPVTVITYKGARQDSSGASWTHVHLTTRLRGPLRTLVLALQLSRLCTREKYAAVLGVLTYSNILLFLADKLVRQHPRLVASEHNPVSSIRRVAGLRNRLQRAVLPIVYRRLPLVAVSQAIADDIAASGVARPGQVRVIDNPVDIERVRRRALESPAEAVDSAPGVHVVCVARLHEQKGLPVLLQALAATPPEFRLTLVGDGPMRQSLSRQARSLGLTDRVRFLGQVDNPYPYMRAADVVVLASLWEGFGLVALEAAALRRPFIGTRCDGLQDVCAVLGYPTVTPGSVAELADALQHRRDCYPDEQALARYDLPVVCAAYETMLLPAALLPAAHFPATPGPTAQSDDT